MTPQATSARRGPKPKTRENLIRAGVRMLHESGYAATGIQEIVTAAEVPKGSFYNHFQSKEAFGKEVIDHYFTAGLPEAEALLGDKDIPPIERLRRYFAVRARSFEEMGFVRGCLMGNLSLEIADHSPAIRESIAAHFTTWSRLFEACIAEAQQSGAMKSRLAPSLLAQFILNSWEGALLRMRADKSDRPLTDFQEVIFGSLLT